MPTDTRPSLLFSLGWAIEAEIPRASEAVKDRASELAYASALSPAKNYKTTIDF